MWPTTLTIQAGAGEARKAATAGLAQEGQGHSSVRSYQETSTETNGQVQGEAERKVSFEYMKKIEFDAEEIELQHAHAVATLGNMFSVIKCIFELKGTDGINV